MPGASARRCLRPHDQCSSRARACLRTAAFLTPCAAWPPSLSADRSGAYWFDDEQKQLILSSKAAYEKALGRTITTECAPASDYDQYGGVFYYGEDYHQQYLAKPGARPCERHSCPPDARAPQQLRLPAPRVARACRPCVPSARDAFTRATSPPRAAHACRPRACPIRVPLTLDADPPPIVADCSAQPQQVSLPPFETWAPKGLEHHKPKLPEEFWKLHGPTPHCVIRSPNEPISWP